jgi:hypothetical protein
VEVQTSLLAHSLSHTQTQTQTQTAVPLMAL